MISLCMTYLQNFVGDVHTVRASIMYNTLRRLWSNVRCLFDEIPSDVPHIGNMVFFASQSEIEFSVPFQFSEDIVEYSREWILTHFRELEVDFSSKNLAEVPIATKDNLELIKFDQKSKEKFHNMMLDLFPEQVWKKINAENNVNE